MFFKGNNHILLVSESLPFTRAWPRTRYQVSAIKLGRRKDKEQATRRKMAERGGTAQGCREQMSFAEEEMSRDGGN